MGPRRFQRGYTLKCMLNSSSRKLQWGHAVSSVDTDNEVGHRALKDGASMGPRRFQRGYHLPPDVGAMAFLLLQWGHAVSSVDTPVSGETLRRYAMLQWGHAVSSVDTRIFCARSGSLGVASMGPRRFQRGYIRIRLW